MILDYGGPPGRFKLGPDYGMISRMTIPIDPKVDYAFKHIFGREENKPALISLLDAVKRSLPIRWPCIFWS